MNWEEPDNTARLETECTQATGAATTARRHTSPCSEGESQREHGVQFETLRSPKNPQTASCPPALTPSLSLLSDARQVHAKLILFLPFPSVASLSSNMLLPRISKLVATWLCAVVGTRAAVEYQDPNVKSIPVSPPPGS